MVEGNNTEWWILRKTPNEHNNTSANYETFRDEDKSYFGCSHKEATSYLDDSLTSKSLDVGKSGKRMSDAGCSRQGNKRLSVDNDNKNESRLVSDSNKLNYGELCNFYIFVTLKMVDNLRLLKHLQSSYIQCAQYK